MTHRQFGPLARLDPHRVPADGRPAPDPDGLSVLYVAGNLATAIGEVFGDYPEAQVCPQHRIALLYPTTPLTLLDLRSQGAAMQIGALPSLATGDYPRARTQEWARAIYEDQPVHQKTIQGVYYSAAHTGGPALTLWDTAGQIRVVDHPDRQDFALNDPGIWPRIQTETVKIGLRATLASHCVHT